MNQYILGLDIGTTHTKGVLITNEGKVVLEEKANYPIIQPLPGYSEQDPDLIFEAVIKVLSSVLSQIPDKQHLAAISFSAAMHSVMCVGKDGRPLSNLYTWADTRSKRYAAQLKDNGLAQRIYESSGTPVHPMSPLCKIAWIRDELPDIFSNTHKFISGKEYVFFRLFGKYLIDYNVASATGLFNIHELQWNTESLHFAGITTAHLSEPFSTAHFETSLESSYRIRLGLEHNVPFFLGASDGSLAILGSGAMMPDEAALTIGTSGAVRKISEKPLTDPKGRLFNYVIHDKMFTTGGATNNGGIVLKWFAENMLDKPFASQDAFDWFMQTAAKAPAGSNGLIFMPYIQGERCPVWDADARGVFIGITSMHKKEHFMRAILEGISFSLNQIVQAMEETGDLLKTVYATGGFIQSAFWVQMVSDVLNKKIVVSLAADASALGAGYLAMNSLGITSGWNDVKKMVTTSEVYMPDEAAHRQYGINYSVYESLYEKLKTDFSALSN